MGAANGLLLPLDSCCLTRMQKRHRPAAAVAAAATVSVITQAALSVIATTVMVKAAAVGAAGDGSGRRLQPAAGALSSSWQQQQATHLDLGQDGVAKGEGDCAQSVEDSKDDVDVLQSGGGGVDAVGHLGARDVVLACRQGRG